MPPKSAPPDTATGGAFVAAVLIEAADTLDRLQYSVLNESARHPLGWRADILPKNVRLRRELDRGLAVAMKIITRPDPNGTTCSTCGSDIEQAGQFMTGWDGSEEMTQVSQWLSRCSNPECRDRR